jgi:L-arabinose isomerase
MVSRLRKNRHVIVGHWKDEAVEEKLSVWTRTAVAREAGKTMKVARFGDNMRNVAVTEGDKVEAQMKFGYSVDGYGIGDLVGYVEDVSATEVENLLQEYDDTYSVSEELGPGGEKREALREACRIELGMRCFLEDGGFSAFTTNFETLHGISQLPGLAVQRLMGDGYGFGAEGDWKTAALVRTMKIMAEGLPGGTSFMEDYTYHFEAGNMQVLGAHMLEVCPSIAAAKPSLEVHPLDIGGKSDPVRLVFDTAEGRALNASLVDMGNRFRFILNEVDVISPAAELPNLPVARVVWEPRPDLPTAATAWIYAGGAHHTGFTQALTSEHLELFAEMADIEFLTIDNHTSIREFKKELRWNEAYYR